MKRIIIQKSLETGRTDHLQPVIDLLIRTGNQPVRNEFQYDKDGEGVFTFKHPIDRSLLEAAFEFPESIVFSPSGTLNDTANFLKIRGGIS